MAEYYALLTRAVGRLQSSSEVSRREIYVKARNALIQQLKAINPPLSPAEISKQRLELEEAIRKVERDAASQQTQLTEAEISRSASLAMEEALAAPEPASRASFGGPSQRSTTVIDEAPVPIGRPEPMRPMQSAQTDRRQAPVTRGWPDDTTVTTARAPEPIRETPRSAAAEARPLRPAVVEEEAFPAVAPTPAGAPVTPPPAPPVAVAAPAVPANAGQPKPAAAKLSRAAAPAKTAPPRPMAEARPAAALAGDEMADIAEDRPRRTAKPAKAPKKRRSLVARLIVFVLTLAVLAAIAAAGYLYWDEIKEFIETFGSPPTNQLAEAAPAEGTAAAEGLIADPADGVRQVGPIPPDALPAGEVQTLGPGQAFLYEEGATDVPGIEGTATWRLIPTAGGPEINAVLEFPDRNLQISLSIIENHNAALAYTHEVDVLVTAPPDMPHGAIQSVEILAPKSTEDAIGDALVGVARSIPPDFFYFELAPEAVDQNLTRLRTRGWFDLAFTYADGTRAIFTFEKAPQGEIVFREALQGWAAN